MSWLAIETQADLDFLDKKVCWEDSKSVEYYATARNEDYFPPDVSRSGYDHKNIHVLCRVCSQEAAYLEMVWIHCDQSTGHFLDHPHMSGRVDCLKRVEILGAKGWPLMRCSRVIYRFVAEANVTEGSYYSHNEIENDG